MITIKELTPVQKKLADLLWAMNTWEEIETFVQQLHDSVRSDAVTVIHLMTAATLDQLTDIAESEQYLSRFRLH
jgi:hypothetical protein